MARFSVRWLPNAREPLRGRARPCATRSQRLARARSLTASGFRPRVHRASFHDHRRPSITSLSAVLESRTPSRCSAFGTLVAGTRRPEIFESSLVRTHAQSRAGIESSRARVPYTAGCEFSPETAVRADAQAKNPKSFRAAYAHNRSGVGALRRSSNAKSPVPRTNRPRDAGFPLTLIFLAGPSRSHHQRIFPLSTDRPPKLNRSVFRHERGQDEQSRCRRLVAPANMWGVPALLWTSPTQRFPPTCNTHVAAAPGYAPGVVLPLPLRLPSKDSSSRES